MNPIKIDLLHPSIQHARLWVDINRDGGLVTAEEVTLVSIQGQGFSWTGPVGGVGTANLHFIAAVDAPADTSVEVVVSDANAVKLRTAWTTPTANSAQAFVVLS